jgi:hypothetical protein
VTATCGSDGDVLQSDGDVLQACGGVMIASSHAEARADRAEHHRAHP